MMGLSPRVAAWVTEAGRCGGGQVRLSCGALGVVSWISSRVDTKVPVTGG